MQAEILAKDKVSLHMYFRKTMLLCFSSKQESGMFSATSHDYNAQSVHWHDITRIKILIMIEYISIFFDPFLNKETVNIQIICCISFHLYTSSSSKTCTVCCCQGLTLRCVVMCLNWAGIGLILLTSRPRLNIKAIFPRYGDPHVIDKKVRRLSYP